MVRVLKNDAVLWKHFSELHLQRHSRRKSEGFSRESGGFFRRTLGSYTQKFPKCGAASLTDLPELCLCLLELRL